MSLSNPLLLDEGEDIENGNGPASPLLLEPPPESHTTGMTRSQAYNLYTSHFLSAWNVRTYEFAAVIFTAAAYPDTLTAAAVRGIVRMLASICFSSSVGRWVDRSPDRLRTLMSSISVNRLTVIFCSILWFFIVQPSTSPNAAAAKRPSLGDLVTLTAWKDFIFALILILGIGENLSASGNIMSMERDWLVVASSPDGRPYDLTHLNSVMRRIDLICKLIAPVLISIIISAANTKVGVIVVGGMSASSWAVEMLSARHVWHRNPALQAPKVIPGRARSDSQASSIRSGGLFSALVQALRRYIQDFQNYFSSSVWIPSLSLSLLHFSALSYGATFITFLLSAGFSLDLITIARAVGSLVEISSTVVTPVGVQVLGKAKDHGRLGGVFQQREEASASLLEEARPREEEGRTITGLERLGLWGLSWQLLNLIPVLLSLWALSPSEKDAPSPIHLRSLLTRLLPSSIPTLPQPLLALTLFTFLSLSRLGLWTYDLTTQQLSQSLVLPSQRSAFAGVESSFNAFFELAQHLTVLVLSRPEDFGYVAVMGVCAVFLSTIAYAGWVRRVRGHLVHWDRWGGRCGKGRGGGWGL